MMDAVKFELAKRDMEDQIEAIVKIAETEVLLHELAQRGEIAVTTCVVPFDRLLELKGVGIDKQLLYINYIAKSELRPSFKEHKED